MLMGAAASVMVFAAGAKAQDRDSNVDSWHFDNPAPNDNPLPYNDVGRPFWRWLATSPASQAVRSR